MKTSKSNRRASAGIALLIVLLLVVIVLAVQWWIKSNVKDPDIVALPPWKEWRLRESSLKPPSQLNEQQPHITQACFFDMHARLPEDNSSRGSITLIIEPGGTVGGQWYGDYHHNTNNRFCDILAGDFSGNVYPAKIYRNEQGEEDQSKLYFIAKGMFLLQATDLREKLRNEGGDIYVKGWLDPEHNAQGEIIITSNEKYFQTFTWHGKPAEPKTMRDLFLP